MAAKSNKIISNTAWQVGQQIYTMVLSLVVGSLTARYLGPSNYGLIGYGSSLVALFLSISSLGMNDIVQKELINAPENKGRILGSALCMRLAASCLCMLGIDLLVCVLEPGNALLRKVTFLQSFALILQVGEVLGFWFHVRLEYKYISIGTMIAYTIVCLWRIVLLINDASLEWFAASSCVQHLTSSGVLIVLFIILYPTKLKLHKETAKNIFCASYHFIISGVAMSLYTQMDKIMLGKILSEEMVGYYTAASTISSLWEFLPIAIINSAMVVILENKRDCDENYSKNLALLLCGISLMGMLVAVGITIFGKLAIMILYGRTYMPAYAPMVILAWASCFAVIGCARGSTWVLAENLNKYSKYYVLISAIVNFVLNYCFIPKFGMSGAAMATLISQFTTTFAAPLLFRETRSFGLLYVSSWVISVNELRVFVKKGKASND